MRVALAIAYSGVSPHRSVRVNRASALTTTAVASDTSADFATGGQDRVVVAFLTAVKG